MKNGDQPISPYTPQRPWNDESANGFPGLTKREYFAAMAMQGLLANDYKGSASIFAGKSVQMADALLAELKKPTP